jgi:AcrR family transcriptional regulator
MTGAAAVRRPGRPRSQEVDAAVLGAALELLLERGAAETSIEKVAQRAGVTRATVYRRFADKTALLVQAVETLHSGDGTGDPEWSDIDRMLAHWAAYLSLPRNRRLLRRLYASADDYPDLLQAYLRAHGERRAAAVRATLSRARDASRLPPTIDVELLQQLLTGAILNHLSAYPDTTPADEIAAYLAAVLEMVGYRAP